jgi:hypothetical protein
MNGGKRLYVGRITSQGVSQYDAALQLLGGIDEIGLLALPGYSL